MGKKKKNKKLLRKTIKEMLVFLQDSDEVYEGTCDCDGQQVCDICQCVDSCDSPDETIDEFHYFEILDRVHIIQMTIEDSIREHPAATITMIKKIDQVQELLSDVYGMAGHKMDELLDR